MRRFKQALTEEMCREVLNRGTSGVLALCGTDGQPYAVPLSYAYTGAQVLFHCATAGHKLELLHQNGRCSFCVIDQDKVVPETFTTHYRSVIVAGTLKEITAEEEKREALRILGEKYSHGYDSRAEIEGALHRVCVLKMEIGEITGKQARELSE